MIRIFFALFAFGLGVARAFPIDISRGKAQVASETEFVFENVRLSGRPEFSWARFKWNAQTNSFSLTDFGAMTPAPVGLWDLTYDIDCDGSKGHTTWDLKAGGSCMSGENRPCRWSVSSSGDFELQYQSGGQLRYFGKFTGASLAGRFVSPDGRVKGCWSAVKMSQFRFGPPERDARTGLDSSGAN